MQSIRIAVREIREKNPDYGKPQSGKQFREVNLPWGHLLG